MDINVNDKWLGHVTAYGYAKSKGFQGTEEEFAELMASYAVVAQESEDFSLKSEGFAIGEQDGTPVSSDSPYYHNNAKYYAEEASGSADGAASSANDADQDALKAEGFAVGEHNGVPVESSDEAYHNNAKYYSELSAQSAAQSGYLWFYIENGGLYMDRTANASVTFYLQDGKLYVEEAV